MHSTHNRVTKSVFLGLVLIAILLHFSAENAIASENETTQHFKILSTVEYSGKGQFTNKAESLITVKKQFLSDNKVSYLLSTHDINLFGTNPTPGQPTSPGEFSFVVDRNTRQLSTKGKDWKLFEKVNNQCAKLVKGAITDNIGKTWKESFQLPFLGSSFAEELKFTLTALELETEALGKLFAVRALSEPFVIKASFGDDKTGDVRCRVNTLYLFDETIEDIYMSISVFEAVTKANGKTERLRHEVATYMTDAEGTSLVTGKLSKKFEKLVRKVGLAGKGLKIKKETSLPQWAKSEGLGAAQISNICAAVACEGALNPVVTVLAPAARMVSMQSFGAITSVAAVGTVSTSLATSVSAVGGMKIAAAPAIAGMSAGTAAAVGGGTVAAASGSSGGGGSRSPSN